MIGDFLANEIQLFAFVMLPASIAIPGWATVLLTELLFPVDHDKSRPR